MREPTDLELEGLEQELRLPLSRYITRSPKTEETKALIGRLQAEFNLIGSETQSFQLTFNEKIRRPSLLKQVLSQAQTYQKAFWVVSIIVFAMLTLMSGAASPFLFDDIDLFSVSVPIFLLSSFAYSYRSWNREMRMVESITPLPPAVLLLSRLMILIALNIVLGFIGSLYLKLTSQSFHLLPFLMHWLALLLFIGGLLAYLMFRLGLFAGMIVSVLAWGGWISMKEWFFTGNLSKNWVFGMEAILMLMGSLLLILAFRRLALKQVEVEGKLG